MSTVISILVILAFFAAVYFFGIKKNSSGALPQSGRNTPVYEDELDQPTDDDRTDDGKGKLAE